MTVSHSAALRNDLALAVLAFIDGDAAAGNLILQTDAFAEVATLPLAYPAGSVTAEVLTFNTTPAISDTNATGGVTTRFKITDNSGDDALAGSVGASGSGADIILSSTTIDPGDTVQITSLVYNASP